jgi:phenylalanyl-tRNA synthetase beta chain
MLRALRWNLDRGRSDLRLFEIGKTYSPSAAGLADECRVLTLGLTGRRRAPSVHDAGRDLDFFDLKGDLEVLFEAFGIRDLRFEAAGCDYFDKDRSGRFTGQEKTLAVFGRLSADFGRDYRLRQEAWLAEVDLDLLLRAPLRSFAFREFSKFPAVERDFSLVIPEGRTYREIEEAVRGLGLEALQGLVPADFFRGGALSEGHYSLLLRVVFQSPTHTLTSEEIAEMSQQVLGALQSLGVRLRA